MQLSAAVDTIATLAGFLASAGRATQPSYMDACTATRPAPSPQVPQATGVEIFGAERSRRDTSRAGWGWRRRGRHDGHADSHADADADAD